MEESTIIAGATYYRHQFSILRLCEILHMYSNGALEGCRPESMYVALAYLRWRYENWNESIGNNANYDQNVEWLVGQAIDDCDAAKEFPGRVLRPAVVPYHTVFNDLKEALVDRRPPKAYPIDWTLQTR